MRSVFFATPTYDCMVSHEHHGSMITTTQRLAALRIGSYVATLAGCAFVDRARNELVRKFLASDCDELFFIDADIGFDSECIPRFMSHEVDIVVGIPPKRQTKPEYHIGVATQQFKNGLFECKEAPTAFMKIKRRVFEMMDEAYPELKTAYANDDPTPYFQCGIVNRAFLGEDIFFCKNWAKMGQSVWIDAQIDFIHRGSHPFKGNCLNHLVETKQVVLKEIA